MTAFLYFVAGRSKPLERSELATLGLAHVVDDGLPYNAELGRGPSDTRGMLVVNQPALGDWQPVYRPEEQAWRRRPGSSSEDEVWVGYYTAAPPTPATLSRLEQLPGELVRLADGRQWLVPRVRVVWGPERAESAVDLPAYVDLDDAGRPIRGAVLARYRRLAAICDGYWDAWYQAVTAALAAQAASYAISYPTLAEDAAAVLGENYRVTLFESALLELFTTSRSGGLREACDVLGAACDCDLAHALLLERHGLLAEKKTDGEAGQAGVEPAADST